MRGERLRIPERAEGMGPKEEVAAREAQKQNRDGARSEIVAKIIVSSMIIETRGEIRGLANLKLRVLRLLENLKLKGGRRLRGSITKFGVLKMKKSSRRNRRHTARCLKRESNTQANDSDSKLKTFWCSP